MSALRVVVTFAAVLAAILVQAAPATSQSASVEGRVLDSGLASAVRGTPVEGAVVTLLQGEDSRATGLSGEDGRFRIAGVAPGRYTLRVERLGFAVFEEEIDLVAGATLTRDLELDASAITLEGMDVEAARTRERIRFEETGGISVRELSAEEVQLVPGVAEADPLRAVAVLPGVVTTSDFTSSFNVRGGSADQNLILVDGIPILSPFHLGGVFSVFNAEMIERAELQSGGFPAEHGGRVSSVLLVETDPGPGEFAVDAGVSLIAARATVSGGWDGFDSTLGTSDTRWRIAGRRSYVDILAAPFTEVPYNLTDLQGVFQTSIDDRTVLRISGYTGEDVVDFTDFDPEVFPLRIQWDWGNRVLGARLIRSLSGGGEWRATASTTRFGTGLAFPDFDDTEFRSELIQRRLSTDWVLRRGPLEGRLGGSVDFMSYDNLARTGGTTFGEGKGQGTLLGTYGQLSWRDPGAWLFEAGLRLDHWRPDPGGTITEWSPRLAVKRFFGDSRWAVKAAVGRYTQFLHSLRDEELPIGLDVWVLAGDRAPHVVSDQLQVGIEAFPVEGWNVALEGFYRDFDGVVTVNNADDPNDDFDDILDGTGVSWGADLFVRRTVGEVNGWVSLSWVKAERTFPDVLSPVDPLPRVTYAPIFDRRIDMDVVLRFPALWGWTGGIRLNVGTGTPYTRAVASYASYQPRFLEDGGRWSWAGSGDEDGDGGGYAVVLGERNAERYPVYHRLDVGFRRTFEKSWGTITPTVDLLNVYNRRNVLFYFYQYDETPAQRSGISMFPLLPTIGVEVSF